MCNFINCNFKCNISKEYIIYSYTSNDLISDIINYFSKKKYYSNLSLEENILTANYTENNISATISFKINEKENYTLSAKTIISITDFLNEDEEYSYYKILSNIKYDINKFFVCY